MSSEDRPQGGDFPKRPRLEFVRSTKTDSLSCILHWHEYAAKTFKVDANKIDDVAILTSFIYIAHRKLQLFSKGAGSIITTTDLEEMVHTFGDVKIKDKDFTKVIGDIAKNYGFTYGQTSEDKCKTGTLNAFLTLIVGYKLRLAEVNGNQKIYSYGFNSSYSDLLSGISYSPRIQSSMKDYLGPMTIAIKLCEQTDRKYQAGWIKAFKATFKMLPFVEDLANALAGSKTQKLGLLKQLADLCHFGIHRSSNKALIPASLLMVQARKCTGYDAFIKDGADEKVACYELGGVLTNLDFSGKGLYFLWNSLALADEEFIIHLGKGMSAQTGRELLLHSVFGTHREDLGLLKWMTGHKFQTRMEIADQLQDRGTGKPISVKLIAFEYTCKWATPSQPRWGMQIHYSVFTHGGIWQRVSPDDELFKLLIPKQGYFVCESTFERLMGKMHDVKRIIVQKKGEEQKIHFGTTSFFKVDQANLGEYGTPAEVTFSLEGDYFSKPEMY